MAEAIQMSRVPIHSLVPNPWNTNSIVDPENENRMRESLRRHGVFKPVVVRTLDDGTLQIIGGENRWRFAVEAGHEEIPIANVGKISTARAKEIGLVDNGRYGQDDTLMLASLLQELGEEVRGVMSFSDEEMASVLSDVSMHLEDLDAPIRSGDERLPDLEDLKKPTSSSQMMRFRVQVEDVHWVAAMIDREMKEQGFKDEDALTNAGDALVSLLNKLRGGAK